MKKNKLTLFGLIAPIVFGLFGCGGNSSSNKTSTNNESSKTISVGEGTSNTSFAPSNSYTITWVNYDGTELEVDSNVLEGTLPTYDGETPTKPSTDDYNYKFIGWTPNVEKATENKTYKAVFEEILKIMTFGLYPQTAITDSDFSYELDVYARTAQKEENGWIKYTDGAYYTCINAKPKSWNGYYFEDGTEIVNGKSYWFKCESIKWRVLTSDDSSLLLLSEKILDAHYYNETNSKVGDYWANNYKESSIRSWLNDEFYNSAFMNSKSRIKTTHVDNSAASTDLENNVFACEDTDDNVFLLSYQDLKNEEYGYNEQYEYKNKLKRKAKATDYAIAQGLYLPPNSKDYCGYYWTRSPQVSNDAYGYASWVINDGGGFEVLPRGVDASDYGVVPAITINKAMD